MWASVNELLTDYKQTTLMMRPFQLKNAFLGATRRSWPSSRSLFYSGSTQSIPHSLSMTDAITRWSSVTVVFATFYQMLSNLELKILPEWMSLLLSVFCLAHSLNLRLNQTERSPPLTPPSSSSFTSYHLIIVYVACAFVVRFTILCNAQTSV